jgi:hypothetical protein
LQGTLSETTRTCGREGCRCRRGQRHGPHVYLTFKTREGRSSAVYVPERFVAEARRGTQAWKAFWETAVGIAEHNRARAQARWRGHTPRGGRRRAEDGAKGR